MWKKQDDAEGAQPEFPSKRPDAASIGDAPGESSMNDQFQNGNFAVVAQKVPTEDSDRPLPSPTMETYTEAVKEFTKSATAFIEQLPLLTKARGAYMEAMRAARKCARSWMPAMRTFERS